MLISNEACNDVQLLCMPTCIGKVTASVFLTFLGGWGWGATGLREALSLGRSRGLQYHAKLLPSPMIPWCRNSLCICLDECLNISFWDHYACLLRSSRASGHACFGYCIDSSSGPRRMHMSLYGSFWSMVEPFTVNVLQVDNVYSLRAELCSPTKTCTQIWSADLITESIL